MKKIKSVLTIEEVKTQAYSGHPNFYWDENTVMVFGKCPECDSDIHRGCVSCPDGREGCCVAHYGYGCSGCKKVFEMTFEYEPSTEPEKPWTVSERIGIAVINPRGISSLKKVIKDE